MIAYFSRMRWEILIFVPVLLLYSMSSRGQSNPSSSSAVVDLNETNPKAINRTYFRMAFQLINRDAADATLSSAGIAPGAIFTYADGASAQKYQDLVLLRVYEVGPDGKARLLIYPGDYERLTIPANSKRQFMFMLACMSSLRSQPPAGVDASSLVLSRIVMNSQVVAEFEREYSRDIDNLVQESGRQMPQIRGDSPQRPVVDIAY